MASKSRSTYKLLIRLMMGFTNLLIVVWLVYVAFYLYTNQFQDRIMRLPLPWFRLVISLVGIAVLIGIYRLMSLNEIGKKKGWKVLLQNKYFIPGIFLLTVLMRLAWVLQIGRINLDSDFQLYMTLAVAMLEKGAIPAEWQWYVSYAPYVMGYAGFLAVIFGIFGKSLWVAQLANIVLSGVSSILIFTIANKINQKREVGAIAAIIWAFLPPAIAMVGLPSTEVLFITLLLAAITICLVLPRRFAGGWSIFLVLVLTVLTLGMNEIRPLGILLIAGLVVYKVSITRTKGRQILTSALQLGVFLLVYFGASAGMNIVKERFLGTPISKNAFGFGLYLGLNYETRGTWNLEDSALLGKASQQGLSALQFQSQMTGLSVTRLNDLVARGLLLKHFANKVATFWVNPDAFISWTQVSMENRLASEHFFRVLIPISDGLYGAILLLSLSAIILSLGRKDYYFQTRLFFIKALLSGYFLSLLFFDNNSRYLVPALPLFCLLAASGVEGLSSAIFSMKLFARGQREV